jgi:hypothetical protein
MYNFYAKQRNVSVAALCPQLAQFMNNNLMMFTGPGWLVVEVYSQNSGAVHENPAAGLITNCNATCSWLGASNMTTGDYIIFESTSVANKFQVGIEYSATDTLKFIAAPREGWNTGAGTATMNDSGNWLLPRLPAVDMAAMGTGNYSIVTDADHFNMFYDDGATRRIEMIGKLSNVHTNDTTTSVVIYNQPTVVFASEGNGAFQSGYWYKLSATNQSTLIAPCAGTSNVFLNVDLVGNTPQSWLQDKASGEFRLMPIGICDLTDPAYSGFFGTYDAWVTWMGIGGLGSSTVGAKTYAGISNYSVCSAIYLPWDGTTDLP